VQRVAEPRAAEELLEPRLFRHERSHRVLEWLGEGVERLDLLNPLGDALAGNRLHRLPLIP
jgi:hypothetical protein